MAFMADVTDRAAADAEAALDWARDSGALTRLFGSEDGLLLSLRHRWVTMLAAKLDQADHDDVPAARARAELAAAHPGLRALLDVASRRSVRVRALDRDERAMVRLYAGSRPDDLTVA
jgi:ATP adenylyltransferase